MSEQNQWADSLQQVQDIKRIMERSSRFTSLSGLSCVAAGLCALGGAWLAYRIIQDYYQIENVARWYYTHENFSILKNKLLLVAAGTFTTALLTAFFFTWRKAGRMGIKLTDHSSRKVFWAMAVPLVIGGLFVLGMLQHDEWRFVSSSCLVFYGLALVNAGKYTVSDIRYLGYMEAALGLVNLFVTRHSFGYGLYFWVAGFGLLHIIYGVVMWWKYERKPAAEKKL